MHTHLRWTAILFCLLTSVGCSLFRSKQEPKTVQAHGVQVLTMDASSRASFLAKKDAGYQFCAEPFPDTSLSEQESISMGLANEKDKTTEAALGGRTPAVLVTREVLFRLCEMGVNHGGTYADQSKLFRETLVSLGRILNGKSEESSKTDTSTHSSEPEPNPTPSTTTPLAALPKSLPEKKTQRAPASFVGYTVQVAAYQHTEHVKAHINRLTNFGFSAFSKEATINGEAWMRVFIGHFLTLKEANAFKQSFTRTTGEPALLKYLD